MKMHLSVCILEMLFTQRCYNMIVQTKSLTERLGWLEWHSHGLPTSCLIWLLGIGYMCLGLS
jgi:hypothetical protein